MQWLQYNNEIDNVPHMHRVGGRLFIIIQFIISRHLSYPPTRWSQFGGDLVVYYMLNLKYEKEVGGKVCKTGLDVHYVHCDIYSRISAGYS